jgi:perosamine synthetase
MMPRRLPHFCPGEAHDIKQWLREEGSQEAVTAWEAAIADYVGMPAAAAVSSGRQGMVLILEHLGIGQGDEVIIPAYTLKDLAVLIQKLGARPVPADISPDTLNVTPQAIRARLNSRTKAVIALHAFGVPCPIEEVVAVAKEREIPVIEDCAHALGASVGGRQVGTFGEAAFFSFEATKPVNTFGGGMVVSRDDALLEKVRAHNARGADDSGPFEKKTRAARTERLLFATKLAFPFLYLLATPQLRRPVERAYRSVLHAPPKKVRYLPAQAKLGLRKLPSLAERIRQRRRQADLLAGLLRPDIDVQRVESDCTTTWYFFVALLPCEASKVRKGLLMRGIDAGIEDEIADNCARLLEDHQCPNVHGVYSRAIVLPLHEGLSDPDIEKLARTLNALVP